MLNDPAYESSLKEMGLFDVELSEENKLLICLYNDIVDPTNLTINWQDYFLFCYLDNYPNWKDNKEIILYIRETLANYREKRSDKSRTEQEQKNRPMNDKEEPERIHRA